MLYEATEVLCRENELVFVTVNYFMISAAVFSVPDNFLFYCGYSVTKACDLGLKVSLTVTPIDVRFFCIGLSLTFIVCIVG